MSSLPAPDPAPGRLVPPSWESAVLHAWRVADCARADVSPQVHATAHLEAAVAIESDELDPIRDTGWRHGWRTGLPGWLAETLDAAAAYHRVIARPARQPSAAVRAGREGCRAGRGAGGW